MSEVDNRLFRLLPGEAGEQLVAGGDIVELGLGDVLYEPGDAAPYAYFPIVGFVSLLKAIEDRPSLEVGMVGQEGMVGVHIVLGVARAPLRAVVQGRGIALRVGIGALEAQLKSSHEVRQVLNRYVYVLMEQHATSAVCLRHHHIRHRLARWLLMTQDRARTDRFPVTQEFLAWMLGVRRVSITAAARALQQAGLIRYLRGELTVLHRHGLEEAACSCYASDRQGYAETLG